MIVYGGNLYQRYAGPLQPFEGVIVWRSYGSGGATPTPTPTPAPTSAGSGGGSSLSYDEWLARHPWLRDVPIRPNWYDYPEDKNKLRRKIVKVAREKKSVERKLTFAQGRNDLDAMLAKLNGLQEELAKYTEFYRQAMAAYKSAAASEADEAAEFMELLNDLL